MNADEYAAGCAECGKPQGSNGARGYCNTCYCRLRKQGRLIVERPYDRRPLAERINNYTVDANGCHLWLGRVGPEGYGRITNTEGSTLPHVIAWELANGPVPMDLSHLDHLCHTRDLSCPGGVVCIHRRCLNPAHLEPVTPTENNRRMNSRVVGCSNGHTYDLSNTYLTPTGGRQCRTCMNKRQRDYRARLAVANGR